jgi:23S rRNA pseudouridine1911/1915/1917 synthase
MKSEKILVDESSEGKRADVFLSQKFTDLFSRSQLKKIFEDGKVLVRGKAVSAHYRVKPGDEIDFEFPERTADETRAEDIPLNIIHEDDDLIVLNKPAGMVVHPACGNPQHTLVNALLYHVRGLSSLGGAVRPGIVHRLDKDTSGIMVVAKNDPAHAFLAKQFKDQTIHRVYRVIVRGVVQHDHGICEAAVGRAFLNRRKVVIRPSGGKDAITYFSVLKRFRAETLLEVRLQTGRTHQIRVHMAHMGHPVTGDPLYGIQSPWITRQCVHAFGLGFLHPKSRKEVYFECPIPEDIQKVIRELESQE